MKRSRSRSAGAHPSGRRQRLGRTVGWNVQRGGGSGDVDTSRRGLFQFNDFAEDSSYAIINWARWDESPLRHFWHQLSKPSFWRYVTRNLDESHAASMPIYCRLA